MCTSDILYKGDSYHVQIKNITTCDFYSVHMRSYYLLRSLWDFFCFRSFKILLFLLLCRGYKLTLNPYHISWVLEFRSFVRAFKYVDRNTYLCVYRFLLAQILRDLSRNQTRKCKFYLGNCYLGINGINSFIVSHFFGAKILSFLYNRHLDFSVLFAIIVCIFPCTHT